MSQDEHAHGHDELRQEQDHVESKTIVAIGVIALAIFGVGVFWAVQIQKESTGTVRSMDPKDTPLAQERHAGKLYEVGMVYQSSFDNDFGAKLKAEQTTYLNEVGWLDQGTKKVHIPIKRAMQEYLAESEKAGGKL